jgi:hypothetical protein
VDRCGKGLNTLFDGRIIRTPRDRASTTSPFLPPRHEQFHAADWLAVIFSGRQLPLVVPKPSWLASIHSGNKNCVGALPLALAKVEIPQLRREDIGSFAPFLEPKASRGNSGLPFAFLSFVIWFTYFLRNS